METVGGTAQGSPSDHRHQMLLEHAKKRRLHVVVWEGGRRTGKAEEGAEVPFQSRFVRRAEGGDARKEASATFKHALLPCQKKSLVCIAAIML